MARIDSRATQSARSRWRTKNTPIARLPRRPSATRLRRNGGKPGRGQACCKCAGRRILSKADAGGIASPRARWLKASDRCPPPGADPRWEVTCSQELVDQGPSQIAHPQRSASVPRRPSSRVAKGKSVVNRPIRKLVGADKRRRRIIAHRCSNIFAWYNRRREEIPPGGFRCAIIFAYPLKHIKALFGRVAGEDCRRCGRADWRGHNRFAVRRPGDCGDRLVGETSDLASMHRSGPAPLATKAKLLANDLAAAGL